MELTNYIKAGVLKKGSVTALADYLGLHPNAVTAANGHRRGIPNDAAVKLAQLLGVPEIDVIAASELATERKEDKRAFWLRYTKTAKLAHAASITALLAPIVTNFVTRADVSAGFNSVMRLGFFVLCKIGQHIKCHMGFLQRTVIFAQIDHKTTHGGAIQRRLGAAIKPQ